MTRWKIARAALAATAAGLFLPGCSGMSKIDYTQIHRRDGWQKPDFVIAKMRVEPGQRVADIGAGDGYFTFRLAEAVGPEGTVYAVEVDEEKLAVLREMAEAHGAGNVTVVQGSFDDPMLPDGVIDRVLLVNTYHHIDDRVDYFRKLRQDLAEGGTVANVDMRDDLTGILRLFATEGHWMSVEDLQREMEAAGYVSLASFDELPVQSFELFDPTP